MYRRKGEHYEVLLVHPGGPFWTHKDAASWFIPKGEIEPGEDYLTAAKREFQEETAIEPRGAFLSLGAVKHRSGKIVEAWAFEGDCDPTAIKSNTFALEWPPHSGKQEQFPEIDRAAFFSFDEAKAKIYPAEYELLNRLQEQLGLRQAPTSSTHEPAQRKLFE